MVKLLAGSAGSGKTKIMIDNANKEIENVRGTFVYVESTDKHMQLLNSKIRFVSTEDIKIDSFSAMYGFICGLTSANYDIQKIYIDGILKIVKEDLKGYKSLWLNIYNEKKFISLSTFYNVDKELKFSGKQKTAFGTMLEKSDYIQES